MMGGAEKLWMGLLTGFNRFTPNPCELFKFPVDEFSFWNLVDAYKYFYELDLSGFDMVISGKYPAWMCQHPNHLVYMLHPLRGLYDQYGSQPTSLWGITSQQSNQVQYSPSVKYIWNLLGDSSTTIEVSLMRLTIAHDRAAGCPPIFLPRSVDSPRVARSGYPSYA